MNIVIGVIVGILMLMFLVTAHEFGHFLMARRNGVKVVEFGICFPPRAVAWQKVDGKWRKLKRKEWDKPPGKGLVISLNWLPIGGFCQMYGESDADNRRGSFGRASYWQKTKILFGGVAMNWLVAFVLLTVLAFMGMPHFLENQFVIDSDVKVVPAAPVTIGSVVEGSPAAVANLQAGDVVKRMQTLSGEDATMIVLTEDLLAFDQRHAGETVLMSVERNEAALTAQVELNDATEEYILGAGITGAANYKSTWSAPLVGLGTTLQLTGETFKGLGSLCVNLVDGLAKKLSQNAETREEGNTELKTAGDSVSGPVGIIGILFPAFTESGARNLFFLVALISVSLACMNVLPIPALDGGRWLMISAARLKKKRLSKAAEEKIVGRSFMVILILALIVTILDVFRLIG